MSAAIFNYNESELDRMLEDARPELARLGIAIADGSARDALVWAFSFSTERQLGSETQRLATTITLNGDAPLSIQTIAIAPRLTHRIAPQPLPWPELRRRGVADVVAKTLAAAQGELQMRIGVDYAYEELARRCDRMLDLIGDDVPEAAWLRQEVAKWRDSALARSLYSRARPALMTEFRFGHLDDDLRSLNEFYEHNIFRPLSSGFRPAPPPPTESVEIVEIEHSRRPAILDQVADAAKTSGSGEPVNAVGIVLLIAAIIVVAIGIVRMSWPVIAGGAIFLALVVRAIVRWRG